MKTLLGFLGGQVGLAFPQAFLQRLTLSAHLTLDDLDDLLSVGFDLLELFGLGLLLERRWLRLRGDFYLGLFGYGGGGMFKVALFPLQEIYLLLLEMR